MKKVLIILTVGLFGCGHPSITLEEFHTCEATIIRDTDDAIAIYAETIDQCGKESIIALKKFDFRDTSGRAHYIIIDTIRISLKKDQVLTTTYCNDWETQNIILGTDATKENFGQILRSWTYNEKHTKLIEVETSNLNCLNEDLIY